MNKNVSPRVRNFLDRLMQDGRYFFTSAEVSQALGVSRDAAKLALHRLSLKGEVASPGRGAYVIVPPEYRALGCLPADQFIPALMEHAGQAYYAGLLSAAQYHGSAHHRPQVFQVMVGRARRPIACGKVRVTFHVRRHIAAVPLQYINTPRGTIAISTPEATALDLVGYEAGIGGLDAVATVLAELAEKLDAQKLHAIATTVPVTWVQRLGYLLELIGAADKAQRLKTHVKAQARQVTALLPSAPVHGQPRNPDWKLIVNARVEAEA